MRATVQVKLKLKLTIAANRSNPSRDSPFQQQLSSALGMAFIIYRWHKHDRGEGFSAMVIPYYIMVYAGVYLVVQKVQGHVWWPSW